jgi:heme-degrading monooxygenase HmoA
MVARIWKGRTRRETADAYAGVVLRTGVTEQHGTPGNRGSWILRRINGDHAEYVVISLWDSIESIAGFAGPDVERARYYPEDDEYLIEKPATVTHYEVVHFGNGG